MKKKHFNINLFLFSTFGLGVLTVIPFISIYSADGPAEISSTILSYLHAILEFPTYTLFWILIVGTRNIAFYLLAYAVNCMFYGMIIERVFTLYSNKK